jgi:RimJ/RimL family protein N-acetyltransferase
MTLTLERTTNAASAATQQQLELLCDAKSGKLPLWIPIRDSGGADIGHLEPLTERHLGDDALIERFVRWRNQNLAGWLDQRQVTGQSTRRWLQDVVTNPTRLTFLIYLGKRIIGRCGLLNLTRDDNEADGLIRGERGGGLYFMFYANVAMLAWEFDELGIDSVFSKVLSTNDAAIESCRRLGFSLPPFAVRTLYRHDCPDGIVLRENGTPDQEVPGAQLLYVRLSKANFRSVLSQWRN